MPKIFRQSRLDHNAASGPVARTLSAAFAIAMLSFAGGCDDLVNPSDYGTGAEGEAVAQCIMRSERISGSLTRSEVERACVCLTERIANGSEQPLSGGTVVKAENQRALMRCAQDLGLNKD
jgi:hypothetical protein